MRWSQLTEASGYENIYDKDATIMDRHEDVLKKYVHSKEYIYRGMKDVGDFGYGDGNNLRRKSRSTSNYYTLIMDNDVSWAGYPDRSKSFICSTDYSYSSTYGIAYVVVPLENQAIGVCPNDDLWESFGNIDPSYVNSLLDHLARRLLDEKLSQTDNDVLLDQLTVISEKIANDDQAKIKANDVVQELIQETNFKIGENLYQWYVKTIDPKKNGFNVTKDFSNLPPQREVWMSGKVLFINIEKFSEVENYYKEN